MGIYAGLQRDIDELHYGKCGLFWSYALVMTAFLNLSVVSLQYGSGILKHLSTLMQASFSQCIITVIKCKEIAIAGDFFIKYNI